MGRRISRCLLSPRLSVRGEPLPRANTCTPNPTHTLSVQKPLTGSSSQSLWRGGQDTDRGVPAEVCTMSDRVRHPTAEAMELTWKS